MHPRPPATTPVQSVLQQSHHAAVDEVKHTIDHHSVVVIGMGWNILCRKAKAILESNGVSYVYLEYGNYLSAWRKRLEIKMWTGWPTYPQVFVNGRLVGGHSDLSRAMASGEFREWLAAGR